MSLTFNYNSFEIVLVKQKDFITIRCLDKELFKVYQEVYNDMTINELCPVGVDNFYEICKTSLDVLQKCEQNEDISVVVICNEKNVKIQIDYNLLLHFNFTLRLPLTENVQMNGQDMYIKKLEKNIEQLKEFIDNNMCIPVYQKPCNCHDVHYPKNMYLPINCNTMHFGVSEFPGTHNFENNNFSLNFHSCGNNKLLPNFKIIKCKLLIINGNLRKDIGWEHLPSSTEQIQLVNSNSIPYILNADQKTKLPILHTIDIKDCGDLSFLTQDIINSLSIKKLRVSNSCTNFNVTSTKKCTIERY